MQRNTLEAISPKRDAHLLHNIGQNLKKQNYSTRTEFIRSAIREKLEELKREQSAREFLRHKGKSRIKQCRSTTKKLRKQH